MINRTRFIGVVAKRYKSSLINVSFTPNEDIYKIEGDLYSQQENIAAIPKRPIPDVKKVHVEILSPEDTADLVVNPEFNDAFFASFARRSPFSGDANYKPVPKDKTIDPKPVELLFADITRKYHEVYKEQIFAVSKIPENQSIATLSRKIQSIIEDKITQLNIPLKRSSPESLKEAATALNAFQNTRRVSLGEVTTQEYSTLVTLENFIIYCLVTAKQHNEFQPILGFLTENTSLITPEGLRRIVETLALASKDFDIPTTNATAEFLNHEVFPHFSTMVSQLPPLILDDLAKILSSSGNIQHAASILEVLVYNLKFIPNSNTISSFLEAYETNKVQLEGAVDNTEFVRDVSFLKPVVVAGEINSLSAELILKYGVSSFFELENFINIFIERADFPSVSVLNKLIELDHDTTSSVLKSVRVTQLVKRLRKAGVDIGSTPVLKDYLKELNN